MVEGEALAPDERPLVAAVIYNRLHAAHDPRHRRDDPLRAARPGDASRSRESSSQRHDPYNTRNSHDGLPPTPIANPGLASMQAAAHPAKVDYLYFVRKPDKCTTTSPRTTRTSSITRPQYGY